MNTPHHVKKNVILPLLCTKNDSYFGISYNAMHYYTATKGNLENVSTIICKRGVFSIQFFFSAENWRLYRTTKRKRQEKDVVCRWYNDRHSSKKKKKNLQFATMINYGAIV
jgi:hypothetical protein